MDPKPLNDNFEGDDVMAIIRDSLAGAFRDRKSQEKVQYSLQYIHNVTS